MRYILSVIVGSTLLYSCSNGGRERPMLSANDTVPVKLIEITSASQMQSIQVSGTLSTEETANLSFKTGGVIQHIYVKEGDHVKKGQLLATINPTEINAHVSQASLAFEKAKRDLQRAENLYADSVATLEQLQNARTAYSLAKESLQQVKFNKEYSQIHAPANGFIAGKRLNAGEVAAAGAPVLTMNVASRSGGWILSAGLSDHQWAIVQKGSTATVKIDAFPDENFSAKVVRKSMSAQHGTGAFNVELEVDLNNVQAAAGMFGKATLSVAATEETVRLPYEALVEADGRKGYVFVSDDRQAVQKVEVRISSISEDSITISEGLENHRFLVVSGSPYLRNGSLIKAL